MQCWLCNIYLKQNKVYASVTCNEKQIIQDDAAKYLEVSMDYL